MDIKACSFYFSDLFGTITGPHTSFLLLYIIDQLKSLHWTALVGEKWSMMAVRGGYRTASKSEGRHGLDGSSRSWPLRPDLYARSVVSLARAERA